ncbi:MAG TPA: hypothetical protein VFQ60_01315 [Patescibacteria group bacterium]|nr:hypothetical protein [Patescibacteria group bacterium]
MSKENLHSEEATQKDEAPKKKKKTLLNRLAGGKRALALAAGLHAAAGAALYHKELGRGMADVERTVRKLFFGKNETEFKKSLDVLENKIKEGKEVDYADFYLPADHWSGGLSKKEIEDEKRDIEERRARFHALAKTESNRLKVIHEILQEKGRYVSGRALVSDIFNKGEGNCDGRIGYGLIMIHDVYPDIPLKIQVLNQNNERHERLIGRLEGVWYALETTPIPLKESDLEGTVLIDVVDILKTYQGKPVFGQSFSATGGGMPVAVKQISSNSYLGLKLERPPTKNFIVDEDKWERPMSFEQAQAAQKNWIQVSIGTKKESKKEKKEEQEKKEELVIRPSPTAILNARITGELDVRGPGWLDEDILIDLKFGDMDAYKRYLKKLDRTKSAPVDLEMAEGIPLKTLFIHGGTPNPEQLKKFSSLTILQIMDTQLTDLSFLKNMPDLETFIYKDGPAERFDALRKTRIRYLVLKCPVDNLSFVEDMSLKTLFLSHTQALDVSPLRSQSELKVLKVVPPPWDLSPLREQIQSGKLTVQYNYWSSRLNRKTFRIEEDDE